MEEIENKFKEIFNSDLPWEQRINEAVFEANKYLAEKRFRKEMMIITGDTGLLPVNLSTLNISGNNEISGVLTEEFYRDLILSEESFREWGIKQKIMMDKLKDDFYRQLYG